MKNWEKIVVYEFNIRFALSMQINDQYIHIYNTIWYLKCNYIFRECYKLKSSVLQKQPI